MFSYLYKATGVFATALSESSLASLMSLGSPTFSKNLCAVGESSSCSIVNNILASNVTTYAILSVS